MTNNNILRIDKFLWCIRIFKTRKIASHACNKRKIKINNYLVKPSKPIKINDIIKINKEQILYEYKVIKLCNNRLPAKSVTNFIDDITPQKELDKLKIKRIYPTIKREKGSGRPTKKERRILIKNKLIN